MGVVVQVLLLPLMFNVLSLTLAEHEEHTYVIPVHSNYSACVHCDCPCGGNLTGAFEEAKHHLGPVLVQMGPGCFSLESAEAAVFRNRSNSLTIAGNGTDLTVVCCLSPSGLSFFNSRKIRIENVTFHGCGALQNSTSKNYTDNSTGDNMSYLKFQVGLYFLSCMDVNFTSVSVTYSNGTGVVLYNTGGTNVFSNSVFSDNQVTFINVLFVLPGGGGVVIEFSYCIPGDPKCDTEIDNATTSRANYIFDSCSFTDNVATAIGASRSPIFPHMREHNAFGRGGGLSVHFKGNATHNVILLENCYVQWNEANWGGGLYLKFEDRSQNNTVLVRNSWIEWNQLTGCVDLVPQTFTGGGGVRIDYIYLYPSDQDMLSEYVPKVTDNNVTFDHTHIWTNYACWGGGVSLVASREKPGQFPTNSLQFFNCSFRGNWARIAAAVDLSVWHPDPGSGILMEPRFVNCIFLRNTVDRPVNIAGYQERIGAMYVNGVPTRFEGETLFKENSGTGLAISDAGVHVMDRAVMKFVGNSGRQGGALALFGNAWITAHEETQFLFANNSAKQKGGAIYAVHFGEHDLYYQRNCFIRYYKFTVDPNHWTVSFKFTNNSAANGKSIYATSLLPCVWHGTESFGDDTIDDVFCQWKNWTFDHNCTTEVTTATAGFNNSRAYEFNTTAFPGQRFPLPIQPHDDYRTPLSLTNTVFTAWSKSEEIAVVDPTSQYTANGSIAIFGIQGEPVDISLDTLDPRVISIQLTVTIKPCPPGFISQPYHPRNETGNDVDGRIQDCNCGIDDYFKCDEDMYKANIRTGYCFTYLNRTENGSRTTLVVGECPYVYRKYQLLLLPQYAYQLEESMCGNYSRRGRLCGKCQHEHGVAANSYRLECVKCTNYSYMWLIYILTEFLPITLFFVIVAFLNISVTAASMNGFVFFSQIVSLPYVHGQLLWAFGTTLEDKADINAVLIPYGIWNLDFFRNLEEGFCLSPHLSTVHIVALKYLTAFYPLILILACYVSIELHDRNFRLLVWLWKPFQHCLYRFRRSWEPKTSIIDAFATFLLLSYTRFSIVSFYILTPTHMYDVEGNRVGPTVFYFDASMEFFEGEHLLFALLAIIVLLTFVVTPPVFLLIYSYKAFHRCISTCPLRCHALHTFADAFQGCFKDGTNGTRDCRYFSALYFFFRIIIFAIYVAIPNIMVQYLVQQVLCTLAITVFAVMQPYKKNVYNYLDIAIFTLLAVLNSLSFYNAHLAIQTSEISKTVFDINYCLLFLPLMYITGLVIYQFLMWKNTLPKLLTKVNSQWIRIPEGAISEISSVTDEIPDSAFNRNYEEEFPDRLLNPQNYGADVNSMRGTTRDYTSENSYFGFSAQKRRQYGSINSERTGRSSDTAVQAKAQEFHKVA